MHPATLPFMTKASGWADFLAALMRDESGRQTAERTGVDESTISRWRKGTIPQPSQAVAFARAYGADPIYALIAAGYLTEGDFPAARPRELQLRDFSDLEIARELVRRVEAGEGAHELLTEPLDDQHPAMSEAPSNVTSIRRHARDLTAAELEAERAAANRDDTEPHEDDDE